MITKNLKDLEIDQKNYQKSIQNCETEEEEKQLKIEYLKILKLYLYESKTIIKELFHTEITPFQTEIGYNALYTGGANNITKKSKINFFKEIDQLINSEVYLSLNNENKILINNAFYVLKTYYEDSLI